MFLSHFVVLPGPRRACAPCRTRSSLFELKASLQDQASFEQRRNRGRNAPAQFDAACEVPAQAPAADFSLLGGTLPDDDLEDGELAPDDAPPAKEVRANRSAEK